jgi:hypothetical protein
VSGATINLGSGTDQLTLGDFANLITITNVETIVGGTSDDVVTLGNVVKSL